MTTDSTFRSKYMDFVYIHGILCATYYELAEIDRDGAKLSVEDRKKASNYKPVPILIDARKIKSIDKAGRDYFGSDEGSELLTAAAILVDSVFTRHLANFVMKISFKKQKIPIMMFNSREKAIEWLKKYRRPNIN